MKIKKINIYSIEEQMLNYNLTKEEAIIKIEHIKEKLKKNKFNIYSIEEQMNKYNLTKEEAIDKINTIKKVNVFSIKWQMDKFNISKEEAIEKIEKIKNNIKKTQLEKSETDFNSMIPSKKEHWIKKGFTEEESILLAKNNIKNAENNCNIYISKVKNNPELYKEKRTNNKEYWIKKGFTEEEAKLKVSERQKTFTLEKCIRKYGKEEGKKIYTDRQKTWQSSLLKNGNLKAGFSKISQELFNLIIEYYPTINLENVYFSTKNSEYFISLKGGSFFVYDFVDIEKMKIIEYNGDEYHANPLFYNKEDNPHPYKKYLTAEEIWHKDAEKLKEANNIGFEVLTIWDSEYKKDKQATLKKCLKFLFI